MTKSGFSLSHIKSGSIGINITHSQDTTMPIGVNLRNWGCDRTSNFVAIARDSLSDLYHARNQGVKIRIINSVVSALHFMSRK